MKYVIALLMLTATLVAWSPNTNPYAVEKTELTEDIAEKLGITIGDEVSYLQRTEKGLVCVKINEKRINLTNSKNVNELPDLQPVLVTSEYKKFKTGYVNNLIPPPKNTRSTRFYFMEDSFEQLVCFYLDHEGRHIEFWYLRENLEHLSYIEVSEENFPGAITSMKISPNPASTHFVLKLDTQNTSNVVIEIYDTSGNLVKQIHGEHLGIDTDISCDVNDLQVGMYSVVCLSEGKMIGNSKLIVMR